VTRIRVLRPTDPRAEREIVFLLGLVTATAPRFELCLIMLREESCAPRGWGGRASLHDLCTICCWPLCITWHRAIHIREARRDDGCRRVNVTG